MSERSMSRRQLLPILMGGAAVSTAVSLGLDTTAQAQPKVSEKDAKYQDHPNNGNKCSACQYFEPPQSCRLVEGKISPDGWCSFFVMKS